MEIYNPTGDVVSLDGYAFPNVSNAPDESGMYEYWNAFPAGASIAPGDVYVIAHPSADPAILAEADHTFTFMSNGDDGFILVMGSEEDFVQIDAIGDWNGDPGSGWPVAGVNNGTKDHSLIRKSDVTSGNGGDWVASAGTNEEDSEWIVLDQNDWTGLGSHDFTGSDECTSTIDGYTNRTLTFDADTELDVVCWESCEACPDELIYHDLTFNVNTQNIEVGPNGMYAGGGFLGDATALPLSDDDGDGVWNATISVLEGTSGNFTFLNSPNEGWDWGAKED
jgi:hypothetical protein